MFDDCNMDELENASENLSKSYSVPIRNEKTTGSNLDQKGKRRALVVLL